MRLLAWLLLRSHLSGVESCGSTHSPLLATDGHGLLLLVLGRPVVAVLEEEAQVLVLLPRPPHATIVMLAAIATAEQTNKYQLGFVYWHICQICLGHLCKLYRKNSIF